MNVNDMGIFYVDCHSRVFEPGTRSRFRSSENYLFVHDRTFVRQSADEAVQRKVPASTNISTNHKSVLN